MATPQNSGDSEQPRKRSIFRRIYDWYDTVDTWRERIDILIGLFKANTVAAGSAATVGVAATAGVVAVAVNPDLINFRTETPPPAVERPIETVAAVAPKVEVKTIRWGKAVVFPVSGVDGKGRRASFNVAVLPKEYTWARKDDQHLARDGRILTDNEIMELFAEDFRNGLAPSGEVIAVGVASQEGDVAEESARAARRSAKAGEWLMRAARDGAVVWRLNLGQYKGKCADADRGDTSWQRPVIMIGVAEAEAGVVLSEALSQAIEGKSNLPSRACYSNFELSRAP
ncbi:MAG: hypothetical protein NW215_02225 [Hyphomicrobiales bacterium]|nr:hypothetical protein [Hyphomicrobiales bacterium]